MAIDEIFCVKNVPISRFTKDEKCKDCCKNFEGQCLASIRIAKMEPQFFVR